MGTMEIKQTTIDGERLYRMLRSAFASLSYNETYLNDINAFPVSDKDTGTNMKRTFRKGLLAIEENKTAGETISSFATHMSMESRGNSGFILSQFFLGLKDCLKDKDLITLEDFMKALVHAYQVAYAAVINPMEGTMLTVMREGTRLAIEKFSALENGGIGDFLSLLSENVFLSVLETHSQMKLLEANNVVDSGALGFYLVVDGMKKSYEGNSLYFDCRESGLLPRRMADVDNPLTFFRYCTEFTIRLKERKGKKYYSDILSKHGDSVVVAINGDFLKVHVHTNGPQDVIKEFSKYGETVLTKVEDLFETPEFARLKNRKHLDYAVVAFTYGAGTAAILEQLGADAAFPIPEGHVPTEAELKNLLGPYLEGNLVVYSADRKIEDILKSLRWWGHYDNLLVVECRGLTNAFFKLASSMFDCSFKDFDKQLDVLRRIKTVEFAFDGQDGLVEKLRRSLSPERLKGFATMVVFGGRAIKQKTIDEISFFFAERDDVEFSYFAGLQEHPLLLIGAM